MSWSNRHIGLAEAECHCWALATRIYRDELGIALPSYEGSAVSEAERAEVEALVNAEAAGSIWQRVDQTLRADIRPFDILVFRRGRHRSHIGIAVDARHMIHMLGHARIDRIGSPEWRPRLTGVYRHVKAPIESAS